MNKNILIIGPARSGKTTLSRLLSKKYGYNVINLDDIINAFEGIPECEIKHDGNEIETAQKLGKFLKRYLIELSEGPNFYNGIKYVIEGTHIDFEEIMPMLNEEKYKEYDSVARIYVSNDYAHECGWEPLVLGWNTSALKTTVYYYDSITNQHYKVDVTASDASFGGAFYDSPWSACGKYVYFSSIDAVENTSYRLNVTTGKGDFVYGGVADMSLCPGYRIYEEDVYFEETADMMVRLFVYEDYIL